MFEEVNLSPKKMENNEDFSSNVSEDQASTQPEVGLGQSTDNHSKTSKFKSLIKFILWGLFWILISVFLIIFSFGVSPNQINQPDALLFSVITLFAVNLCFASTLVFPNSWKRLVWLLFIKTILWNSILTFTCIWFTYSLAKPQQKSLPWLVFSGKVKYIQLPVIVNFPRNSEKGRSTPQRR